MGKQVSHWPIKGRVEYFCSGSKDGGAQYDLRQIMQYMAAYIGQLKKTETVESVSIYPAFTPGDDDTWAGQLTIRQWQD